MMKKQKKSSKKYNNPLFSTKYGPSRIALSKISNSMNVGLWKKEFSHLLQNPFSRIFRKMILLTSLQNQRHKLGRQRRALGHRYTIDIWHKKYSRSANTKTSESIFLQISPDKRRIMETISRISPLVSLFRIFR